WTPATMASLVTTSCLPRGTSTRATSSWRLNAPGAPRVSGRNSRAIRSNSPSSNLGGPSGDGMAPDLAGPKDARDLVEHGVDQPGLGPGIEGERDVDILGDSHLDRRIRPRRQFVDAGAQDAA